MPGRPSRLLLRARSAFARSYLVVRGRTRVHEVVPLSARSYLKASLTYDRAGPCTTARLHVRLREFMYDRAGPHTTARAHVRPRGVARGGARAKPGPARGAFLCDLNGGPRSERGRAHVPDEAGVVGRVGRRRRPTRAEKPVSWRGAQRDTEYAVSVLRPTRTEMLDSTLGASAREDPIGDRVAQHEDADWRPARENPTSNGKPMLVVECWRPRPGGPDTLSR